MEKGKKDKKKGFSMVETVQKGGKSLFNNKKNTSTLLNKGGIQKLKPMILAPKNLLTNKKKGGCSFGMQKNEQAKKTINKQIPENEQTKKTTNKQTLDNKQVKELSAQKKKLQECHKKFIDSLPKEVVDQQNKPLSKGEKLIDPKNLPLSKKKEIFKGTIVYSESTGNIKVQDDWNKEFIISHEDGWNNINLPAGSEVNFTKKHVNEHLSFAEIKSIIKKGVLKDPTNFHQEQLDRKAGFENLNREINFTSESWYKHLIITDTNDKFFFKEKIKEKIEEKIKSNGYTIIHRSNEPHIEIKLSDDFVEEHIKIDDRSSKNQQLGVLIEKNKDGSTCQLLVKHVGPSQ